MEVSAETVRAYGELTGDHNQLHFDEDFVSRTRFGRLIAQGGIATGLLHALVAMDLPGPGSVFLSQEWSFPRPVYIGDTITAEGSVTAVRHSRGVVEMSFVVRNQEGTEVLKGRGVLMKVEPTTP